MPGEKRVPANPYQDVIEWLRSEEGSKWSETRMQQARLVSTSSRFSCYYSTLNDYGFRPGAFYLGGVLSIKED